MTIPDYTNPETAMWDGEKDHMRLPDSIFSIGKLVDLFETFVTEKQLLQLGFSTIIVK